MQNFIPMERSPGKFLVGFSVSRSSGMDVLVKITFFIPSITFQLSWLIRSVTETYMTWH